MNRVRKDGLLSPRKAVPKAVLEAHGGKGDQLGFLEGKGAKDCRQTNWTRKNPEVLDASYPLIDVVNDYFKNTLHDRYKNQMKVVNNIRPDLLIPGTAFTTLTVNKNNRTACHTDKGNVKDGMGCMTVHGDFEGGYFIIPKFKVAFDVRPGDLLLADVHQFHGNDVMSGERLTTPRCFVDVLNEPTGISSGYSIQLKPTASRGADYMNILWTIGELLNYSCLGTV